MSQDSSLYFVTLPPELNELILLFVEDIALVTFSAILPFKNVIQNGMFWKKKLILEYPRINIEIIPSHLFAHSKNAYMLFFDYNLINRAFMRATNVFRYEYERDGGCNISIFYITNYELFGIKYESLIGTYSDGNVYVALTHTLGCAEVYICTTLVAKISDSMAFDMIFHACCNGYEYDLM